jgi:hypothetical protein
MMRGLSGLLVGFQEACLVRVMLSQEKQNTAALPMGESGVQGTQVIGTSPPDPRQERHLVVAAKPAGPARGDHSWSSGSFTRVLVS